jgi:hypothetical protein
MILKALVKVYSSVFPWDFGELFQASSLGIMFVPGFSKMPFIMLRKFPQYPL